MSCQVNAASKANQNEYVRQLNGRVVVIEKKESYEKRVESA